MLASDKIAAREASGQLRRQREAEALKMQKAKQAAAAAKKKASAADKEAAALRKQLADLKLAKRNHALLGR